MNPLEKLDEVTTADGRALTLYRRSGYYFIKIDGRDLMSSQTHGSEEALARLACQQLGAVRAPRVLIGGLGIGYTLRAALDRLPREARVVVAEVFPEVVRWNRQWLGPLAQHPLRDPRVVVEEQDVYRLLQGEGDDGDYHLILLDVDNGPEALTLRANKRIYSDAGLRRLAQSLTRPGVLAIWSATPDRRFTARMRKVGLEVRCETARARSGGKGSRHAIFLATRAR